MHTLTLKSSSLYTTHMEIYRHENAEIAIYKGDKYRRLPESTRKKARNYFKRTIKPDGRTTVAYLHREIYKNEVGEIPDGNHIHHIDKNPLNNDVTNLQCLTMQEHHSLHSREYCNTHKEKIRANLDRIRPMTKVWQQSEAGKAHYIKMGTLSAQKREYKHLICAECGKEYTSNGPNTKYCSVKCAKVWQMLERKNPEAYNVERTCIICDKGFMVNKYRNIKTCSKECSHILRINVQRTKNKGLKDA